MLLFTAAAVGLFGTVTPMITGRIFDSAIPQADRGTLFAFGLALMGTALATSMFKLVQGVASLRVQSKMEYSLQAAMWDCLLVLPTNFFRKDTLAGGSVRLGRRRRSISAARLGRRRRLDPRAGRGTVRCRCSPTTCTSPASRCC